ncbi:MAG: AAA family ATPase [Planctomycetia bacterium]|nr:AAA family ATPase [Planctomycetia bacterium]
MRITSLKIERFGVWEDLNFPKVSRGLNVFFGPNEAGKTTLMQFIRASLYGGADEDRARYIQMALDGRRRRERSDLIASETSDDPRRTTLSASLAASDSNVPEDIRRFLQTGKRAEDSGSTQARQAAQDGSRSWIGGTVTLASDFGEHRLERRYIRRDSNYQSALERKAGFIATDGLVNWSGRFYTLPGLKIAESLIVTGPDGVRVGDYFAKSLTCNLDESTYNGVFAIGLDELQKLGMLNETEAAQMLYRLSVGVDRGSFVQVFQQIVSERNDLLDPKGKPSILTNLLSQRDRARRDSGQAATNLREYARLLDERRVVIDAVANLQDRLDKAGYQKRLRELALSSAAIWDSRDAARVTLASMGEVPEIERDSVEECDRLLALANATHDRIRSLKRAYRAKRAERDAIIVDPALDELAPRVSMLEDDLPKLREIDKQVAALREELADLNGKLSEEEARVRSARSGKLMLTQSALDAINASIVSSQMTPETQRAVQNAQNSDNPSSAPKLPNKLVETGVPFKEIEDYKIPAKRIRRASLRLKKYREDLAGARERLNLLVAKLEQGLTSHSQKNLTEAIEKTGALKTGLRRRIEIERRVAEMTSYRKEMERQNQILTENQAITGAPLYALGAGVLVGLLLFGLALFYQRVDLSVGLLGLLAAIVCFFYKITVEKRNRLKLEDSQRRLGLLVKQLEQANAEAKSLDERFPDRPGSNATFEARLQRANADLAFFESLAPVEAQWRDARKVTVEKEALLKRAEASLKKAHKRWRLWLHDACLPTTLKPSQVRALFARVEIADDLRNRISALCAEIEYLGRERQGIVERCDAALALAPKLAVTDRSPFVATPQLRAALNEHAEVLKSRADLLAEMNALRKNVRKELLLWRRQSREVRRYLAGFSLVTREELLTAVERFETYRTRVAELDAAQQRLDAAIGGFCPEEEIGALLLDVDTRKDLPATIENLTKRIEALDAELKGKLELSGRLGQQADAIAAKKDSIRSNFDAIAFDLRLARMAELWQSRAVAGQMMEDIRRAYERERQPETLREASRYLKRLTNGLYVNIWTPLGEDALFVDASNGETLDVAALSRGTRELLFIAIRLALVVSFEKHGVQMPLIWDDVLVNFDYRRAATAAKLLVDFAKAGRQIFLFTCHEHICRLFLRLGVPVCVLPTTNDPTRRRFRVLTPYKREKLVDKNDVTIDVKDPAEKGPNFVEKTAAAFPTKNLAVQCHDPEESDYFVDDTIGFTVYETPRYAANDATARVRMNASTWREEPQILVRANDRYDLGLRLSDPDDHMGAVNVRAHNDWQDDVALLDVTHYNGTLYSDNGPEFCVTGAPEASPSAWLSGKSSPSGSSSAVGVQADEGTVYQVRQRNVSFDGRVSRLSSPERSAFTTRADSDVNFVLHTQYESTSPTDVESDHSVAPKPTLIDGVDYVPVDEDLFDNVDSLDYDEWTHVFSDKDVAVEREDAAQTDGTFMSFFSDQDVDSDIDDGYDVEEEVFGEQEVSQNEEDDSEEYDEDEEDEGLSEEEEEGEQQDEEEDAQ